MMNKKEEQDTGMYTCTYMYIPLEERGRDWLVPSRS